MVAIQLSSYLRLDLASSHPAAATTLVAGDRVAFFHRYLGIGEPSNVLSLIPAASAIWAFARAAEVHQAGAT